MKQILLPTDFSDNSWNAILLARKLFAGEKCHFIILNCYVPKKQNFSGFKSSLRTGTVLTGLKKASEEGLSAVLSELNSRSTHELHTFSTISSKEELVPQIKRLIPEYDLDLIIMGAKGSTASGHIFMGSNTVAVIKKIRNCPLISVPENFNFQSLKQVVFPTDYTNFYSKDVLRLLIEIVQYWKSQVLVVHFGREFILTDSQKANKEILMERLRNTNCNFEQHHMSSTLSDAISKYAENRSADMICLVKKEHTFLEQLTREPAIKKVVFNTRVPLLAMPV